MEAVAGNNCNYSYKCKSRSTSFAIASSPSLPMNLLTNFSVLWLAIVGIGSITLLYYAISLISLIYRILIPGINVFLLYARLTTDQRIPQRRPSRICDRNGSNLWNRKIFRIFPCQKRIQPYPCVAFLAEARVSRTGTQGQVSRCGHKDCRRGYGGISS